MHCGASSPSRPPQGAASGEGADVLGLPVPGPPRARTRGPIRPADPRHARSLVGLHVARAWLRSGPLAPVSRARKGICARNCRLIEDQESRLAPKGRWSLPRRASALFDEHLRLIQGFEIPIGRIDGVYKLGQIKSPADRASQAKAFRERGTDSMDRLADCIEPQQLPRQEPGRFGSARAGDRLTRRRAGARRRRRLFGGGASVVVPTSAGRRPPGRGAAGRRRGRRRRPPRGGPRPRTVPRRCAASSPTPGCARWRSPGRPAGPR